MFYAMNLKGNSKTLIPTTTSHKGTCPKTCPFIEHGCYAKYSFLGEYWKKLTNGEAKNSLTFEQLIYSIKSLPKGQLWRMNQAGDLDHNDGTIDAKKLYSLIKANKNKNGFTYTHHSLSNDKNKAYIKSANEKGFTINLSSNDLTQADEYSKLKIAPVVTVLPIGADKVTYTPQGTKVVKCPASKEKNITCANCGLCVIADRGYIIGFEAHGTAKKYVEKISLRQI